ncbi:hypothetical protein EJ02DRAFT_117241 [Clathrospora elynae]|uniref:Uncharacterized protein n=1 Tax=Clathrospora elynae TaxID=706981 RepID=A0A6A5SE36_9PLEO|nr:hypothetical protein EJ02DRAFT_117241 [Clathrospora elynae]
MFIIFSTLFLPQIQNALQSMPRLIEESDTEWEQDTEAGEEGKGLEKAEISWEGTNCVRLRLDKGNFSWYELVAIDVDKPNEEEKREEGEVVVVEKWNTNRGRGRGRGWKEGED